MSALRRLTLPVLLAMVLLVGFSGCGNPPGSAESAWREEVNTSLAALRDSDLYRYHMRLENWISVSGQSVYGDEKSEGSYRGGDFSVSIVRTSPAGEEELVYTAQKGALYLQESGAWHPVDSEEAPNPLYDPDLFNALASSYGSISLEGEEERSGLSCRRYLLHLGRDKAQEALPQRAWSYFSALDYELNCRVWIADSSSPPLSMRLEVVGFDAEEKLERYRAVAVLDPYDLNSQDIQLARPGE
ncbi:MAG: hypothetical protein JW854_05285 [Actinobacteria bacterium]|nr:hypothetical protein [Actinomycetota bacterium]